MVAYRIEVLMEFMMAGIPVEKIQNLRSLLEHGRYALTDASHMRNYIPDVQIMFIDQIMEILKGSKFAAVIFDSTSHGVELFTVSIRLWKDKAFLQRLIRFRIIDIPMNATLTAAVLKGSVVRVAFKHKSVIGAIHDSANVNPAAVSQLAQTDWINALDLPCHSHILARVGKRLGVERAVKLIHTICAVMGRSAKISAEWKAYAPPPGSVIGGRTVSIDSLSNIRWYNEHEICCLLLLVITFPRFVEFVSTGMTAMPDPDPENDDDFMMELKKSQKALVAELKPGRRVEADFQKTLLQLHVLLHYGKPLAKWCYFLEGDYPTLPYVAGAYREIEQALSPNTPIKVEIIALIDEIAPVNDRAELMNSVRAMLTPARIYLAKQRLKHTAALRIAELAEYVIPARFRELLVRATPESSAVARDKFNALLKLIPLVQRESLEENPEIHARASQRKRLAILAEVDELLGDCEGIPFDFPLVEFWVVRRDRISNLFDFFTIIGTLQASSGHAERVLSRYQRRFGDANIKDAKEDYVEASIMAEVNAPCFKEELRIVVPHLDSDDEEDLPQ